MKKYLRVIICVVICLVTVIVSVSIISGRESNISGQTVQINDLSNQVDVLEASAQSEEDEVLRRNSGISSERRTRDEDIINSFMSTLFTWNDMSEYEKARQEVIEEYNLSEDSDFVKVFLAPVTDDAVNELFDNNGYNAVYEGSDSYVTSISTDKYSYISIITVSMVISGQESTGKLVFTCDIDGDGNMSNLGAFSIASSFV